MVEDITVIIMVAIMAGITLGIMVVILAEVGLQPVHVTTEDTVPEVELY
jgi:hypothetical protein